MRKLYLAGLPFVCATLLFSGCGVDENGPGENRLVKSQADGSYGVKKSDSGENERRGIGGMDNYTGAGTHRQLRTGGGGDAYSGVSYGLGRQPIYGDDRGGTVTNQDYHNLTASPTGLSSQLEAQLSQQGINTDSVLILGDTIVLGRPASMGNSRGMNELFESGMKVITVSSDEALQAIRRIKGQLDYQTLASDIQTILNDGGTR